MADITRRGALAGATAMVTGAALAAPATFPTDHADAELLRLVAEWWRLEHTALAQPDTDAGDAEMERLSASQTAIAEKIADTPADTLEGFAAKIDIYARGYGRNASWDDACTDERIIGSVHRDAFRALGRKGGAS